MIKNKKYIYLLQAGLLFLAVISVYHSSLDHPFSLYDDPFYISQNKNIQNGITPKFLVWSLTNYYHSNWHPVTWMSHALDIQLYGNNPSGHHLTNLVIHFLNSLLIFILFILISKKSLLSFSIALLFAVHPTHVESVAWISERKDLLSTMFFLLVLVFYHFYIIKKNRKFYLLSLGLLILALMSKPMVVTTPFVLLLMDYWLYKRIREKGIWIEIDRGTLLEKIPHFILIIAVSVVTYMAQQDALAPGAELNFLDRIHNAFVSYCNYLIHFIYPIGLLPYYIHPGKWPLINVIFAFVVILFISFFAVIWRKRRPYFIFGWLFFLGTLIPVIGLIQVGGQAMADRYTYIPYIGLSVILFYSVDEFLKVWPKFKKIMIFLFSFYFIILMILAKYYLSFWSNNVGFWSRVLQRYDVHYEQRIDLSRDIIIGDRVFEHLAVIYRSVGVSLARAGMNDLAIRHLQIALSIKSDDYVSHKTLAILFYEIKKNRDKTQYHLSRAMDLINPESIIYSEDLELLNYILDQINNLDYWGR